MTKRRRSAHSVVTEVAEIIRELFIRKYRRIASGTKGAANPNWVPGVWWDGGETRDGRKRSSIWVSAAKFMIKQKLPIAEFVEYVTGTWREQTHQPVPCPNHLCSKSVAHSFRSRNMNRAVSSERQIQTAMEFQQAELGRVLHWFGSFSGIVDIDENKLKRMALRDESCSLSALFRYCLAVSEEYEDIAEKFFDAALTQYLMSSREYDKIWGDWIPQSFRDVANRLRHLMSGVEQ